MVDILKEFVTDTELTVANIRKLVDDYSLISHYLGQELELHTKYSSPLREGDENPSFSLFYGYGELDKEKLYFKDQIGVAQGDVYQFLKIYFKAKDILQVLEQVNYDLNLGLNCSEKNIGLKPTIIKKIPVYKERPKINIVSQLPTKDFTDFWFGKYEIKQKTLDFFNTKCVKNIHYKYSNKTSVITPKTLSIAYPIGIYNKTYMPYEIKENKFRNDYPQTYVEGHVQLDWTRNDLLIISKSSKENIFFKNHWDLQSVSGKSETTFIPDFIMRIYLAHFKRVVLWLDLDEAGNNSSITYKKLYPNLEVVNFVPSVPEKDPTDIFEIHRKKFTSDLISHVLQIKL